MESFSLEQLKIAMDILGGAVSAGGSDVKLATQIMESFAKHDGAWEVCFQILSSSDSPKHYKFLAGHTLSEKTRGSVPPNFREAVLFMVREASSPSCESGVALQLAKTVARTLAHHLSAPEQTPSWPTTLPELCDLISPDSPVRVTLFLLRVLSLIPEMFIALVARKGRSAVSNAALSALYATSPVAAAVARGLILALLGGREADGSPFAFTSRLQAAEAATDALKSWAVDGDVALPHHSPALASACHTLVCSLLAPGLARDVCIEAGLDESSAKGVCLFVSDLDNRRRADIAGRVTSVYKTLVSTDPMARAHDSGALRIDNDADAQQLHQAITAMEGRIGQAPFSVSLLQLIGRVLATPAFASPPSSTDKHWAPKVVECRAKLASVLVRTHPLLLGAGLLGMGSGLSIGLAKGWVSSLEESLQSSQWGFDDFCTSLWTLGESVEQQRLPALVCGALCAATTPIFMSVASRWLSADHPHWRSSGLPSQVVAATLAARGWTNDDDYDDDSPALGDILKMRSGASEAMAALVSWGANGQVPPQQLRTPHMCSPYMPVPLPDSGRMGLWALDVYCTTLAHSLAAAATSGSSEDVLRADGWLSLVLNVFEARHLCYLQMQDLRGDDEEEGNEEEPLMLAVLVRLIHYAAVRVPSLQLAVVSAISSVMASTISCPNAISLFHALGPALNTTPSKKVVLALTELTASLRTVCDDEDTEQVITEEAAVEALELRASLARMQPAFQSPVLALPRADAWADLLTFFEPRDGSAAVAFLKSTIAPLGGLLEASLAPQPPTAFAEDPSLCGLLSKALVDMCIVIDHSALATLSQLFVGRVTALAAQAHLGPAEVHLGVRLAESAMRPLMALHKEGATINSSNPRALRDAAAKFASLITARDPDSLFVQVSQALLQTHAEQWVGLSLKLLGAFSCVSIADSSLAWLDPFGPNNHNRWSTGASPTDYLPSSQRLALTGASAALGILSCLIRSTPEDHPSRDGVWSVVCSSLAEGVKQEAARVSTASSLQDNHALLQPFAAAVAVVAAAAEQGAVAVQSTTSVAPLSQLMAVAGASLAVTAARAHRDPAAAVLVKLGLSGFCVALSEVVGQFVSLGGMLPSYLVAQLLQLAPEWLPGFLSGATVALSAAVSQTNPSSSAIGSVPVSAMQVDRTLVESVVQVLVLLRTADDTGLWSMLPSDARDKTHQVITTHLEALLGLIASLVPLWPNQIRGGGARIVTWLSANGFRDLTFASAVSSWSRELRAVEVLLSPQEIAQWAEARAARDASYLTSTAAAASHPGVCSKVGARLGSLAAIETAARLWSRGGAVARRVVHDLGSIAEGVVGVEVLEDLLAGEQGNMGGAVSID